MLADESAVSQLKAETTWSSTFNSWQLYENKLVGPESLVHLVHAKSLTVPGHELEPDLIILQTWCDLIVQLASNPTATKHLQPKLDLIVPARSSPPSHNHQDTVGTTDDVMLPLPSAAAPPPALNASHTRSSEYERNAHPAARQPRTVPLHDLMAAKLQALILAARNKVWSRHELIAIGCKGYLIASSIAFALSNLANVAAKLTQNGLHRDYHKKLWETHPQYLDLLLCTVADLSSQKRDREALQILYPVTQALSRNDQIVRKSPSRWIQWLSLLLTLGNTLVSCQRYVEASQAFASVILAAFLMGNDPCGVGTQMDITGPDRGIPGIIRQVMQCQESLMIPPAKVMESKKKLLSKTGGMLPLVHDFQNMEYQPEKPVTPPDPVCDSLRFPHGSLPIATFTQRRPITPPAEDATVLHPLATAAEEVASNALLNMAKLFQDGLNSGAPSKMIYINGRAPDPLQILALYILSMSLRACPSTANNIGILFASLSNSSLPTQTNQLAEAKRLAFEYYQTGLHLDPQHPHLYTNLGSLYRENGKNEEAAHLYRLAIQYDPNFHLALANLASCLKDQGHIEQALLFYRRALSINGSFVEALSGLVNCQGIICNWVGRGSYGWETVSVDGHGNLISGREEGWLRKVAEMVDEQIGQARKWGAGVIEFVMKYDNGTLFRDIEIALGGFNWEQRKQYWDIWTSWINKCDEGANILSTIERAMRICQRRWYLDRARGLEPPENECQSIYRRPKLPALLAVPLATTVLPFHTFTLPFTAEQVRLISEMASNRISTSTLSQAWLPESVFPPPPPPRDGALKVGYISSDFLNHPLAHLMQSVFGMHDRTKVLPICYATSPSDGSVFRQTIEAGSWLFKDVSKLSNEEIVKEIVSDGVHILVNFNGFTKGARNEIFTVRPCPIQISLMGFAGPMGANWCDYLVGDKVAIPDPLPSVYKRERIIYMPRSFFCCDHRQSAPDSKKMRSLRGEPPLNWEDDQKLRKGMRKELFPDLPEDAFLLGNFNQLYKIDPSTFFTWLKILQQIPNAYLWLLQFPKAGQTNLEQFALKWTSGSKDIASRIMFTPVAEKDIHLYRSRVIDLFLDTPECNAHTTAADVIWSGTPIITYPRYSYKLCSRVCASIVRAAFPDTNEGHAMAEELIATSETDYERRVVQFSCESGRNRLLEIRKVLFEERETGAFFDTQGYVRDLERAYFCAWGDWLMGFHKNIYL